MRVLDLFCGAGGAAMGLHRAWPDAEIVGVDIKPQQRYPFTFVQADAMTYPLDGFDFIWASPPCQGYTTMNNRHGSDSPLLIAETRARLIASGVPFCIENVPGAASAMKANLQLCGSSFGIGTWRHRLFETSQIILGPKCAHDGSTNLPIYGRMDGRRLWTRADGTQLRAAKDLNEARAAMGIDWMEWDELREAIPPAYSEFIARQIAMPLTPKARTECPQPTTK